MAARQKQTRTVLAEKRQLRVARLYLQGYSLGQISEMVEVHVKTVQHDLAVVRTAWRERAAASLQRKLESELGRIDLIESEAWAAWEASKADEESTTVEAQSEPVEGSLDKITGRKVVTRRSKRLPSAQYLDRIAWCVEQRCRLLGLYPTGKHGQPPGGPGGSGGGMVLEATRLRLIMGDLPPEALDVFGQVYAKLGVREAPAPGGPLVIDQPEPAEGSTADDSSSAAPD